jgi:enamine deaminase RidA (YjgF/YER057c/UK114 family)
MEILQPAGWAKPRGYANGVAVAGGRQVFIGGQIGWDAQQKLVGPGLAEQVQQALGNIVAILAEAGGRPEHIVRLTWYLTDKREYLGMQKQLGEVYRAALGRHFPPMSVVQVADLLETGAKVEIEATAVVPA